MKIVTMEAVDIMDFDKNTEETKKIIVLEEIEKETRDNIISRAEKLVTQK